MENDLTAGTTTCNHKRLGQHFTLSLPLSLICSLFSKSLPDFTAFILRTNMDFYHRAALILDSLDAKRGSVKGLCMAEGKRGRFGKEGEAARFLKVIVEVLKCKLYAIQTTTSSIQG